MRIQIFTLFILVIYTGCQNKEANTSCNCADEFTFAKGYLEENYAGFQDKVHDQNREAYIAHSKRYFALAQKVVTSTHCQLTIAAWAAFFEDGHVQIHFTGAPGGEPELEAKQKILKSTERIDKESFQFPEHEIEGMYFTSDSSYQIAIVKDQNDFRDYVGIIVHAKSDWWEPGMVKAEFRKMGDGKFLAVNYNLYHNPRIRSIAFDEYGTSDGLWFRAGIEEDAQDMISTRQLSPSTLYIKIRSFEDYMAAAIDSVFNNFEDKLATSPNLILDIRGNGGGSDYTYAPISPWMYTDTVKIIGVDMLASEGNIEAWKNMFHDYPDLPEEIKEQINELISKMEASKGSFISQGDDSFITYEEIKPYPKKIVVLIDGEVGSTGEQFVLEAMQSKKVTLMGQPTGGVLDYANVRRKDLNCMPIGLFYATTRSRRIDQGMPVDGEGIRPEVVLTPELNWIEVAKAFLEDEVAQ
ncbi:MAG: hypothetical protein JJU28_06605 [Cyclobacteriaceae bacterium]|nr:hypothetical protein [Cyclobacteriaceae bacterium]